MPKPNRRRTSRKIPAQSRRSRTQHSRRPKHHASQPSRTGFRVHADSDRGPLSFVRELSQRPATATCVSLLLGATTAMVVAGIMARFEHAFRGGLPAGGIISGAALFALAVGVRVPQRFALWLCTKAWRRLVARGRTPLLADILLNAGSNDRPLYWSVVSVVALTAGLLSALTPVYVQVALRFLDWMQAHFLWAGATRSLLHFITTLIAVMAPLTAVGLAISGAHRLSGRRGQWDTRATAWASVGIALGLMAASGLASATAKADIILVAAAVPTLLATVIAAAASTSRKQESGHEIDDQPACLPLWSDRWPTLLRGSLVVLGGGCAWALSGWAMKVGTPRPMDDVLMPAMFASLGIGVLWGCRERPSETRTIGGFGVACAGAGVTTALGVFSTWADGTAAATGTRFFACASVGVIGFAVAYGRQTLLHRVASRTSEGAKVLARMLGCAALAAWIVTPALSSLLGGPETLMVLALALIALGGTLIIHEPGYSVRTRRIRLGAVFASIGAMILVVLFAPARSSTDVPVSSTAQPLVRETPATDLSSQGLASLPDDR